MKHSREEQIQRHKDLLASDDVCLFTNGGCHVFALALHERFNYPICVISGYSNKGIAHIYCRFVGPPAFAVNVLGFTPEGDRIWNFAGLSFHLIDHTELLGFFQPLSPEGMCGEDWFVQPARQRADRRIEKYADIFSGQRKIRIASCHSN